MLVLCGALLLWGCTPPGPRALLRGDERLRRGQFAQAIEELSLAVRLMPQDPRAWNHLGLAYQASGQAKQALEAYRQALSQDHSNRVFHAHYNLGCLYLDENLYPQAIEEFRSFLMLSNSPPARLKLAKAQVRARQFAEAETSLRAVLRDEPQSPEALNTAGLLRFQVGRPREALQWFEAAVRANSHYGPALYNLATLCAQQPGFRATAIQRYREYLALQPTPANAAAAEAALHQLEPPPAVPVKPALTNTFVAAATKTNPPVVATNPAVPLPPVSPMTGSVAVSAPRPGGLTRSLVPTNLTVRTNAPVRPDVPPPTHPLPATGLVAKAAPPPPAPSRTNPAPAVPSVRPTPVAPPPVLTTTTAPPRQVVPPAAPTLPATSAPLVVVRLAEAPAPKPAQDWMTGPAAHLPVPSPASNAAVEIPSTPRSDLLAPIPPTERKPGLLGRLNPFKKKAPTTPEPPPSRTVAGSNASALSATPPPSAAPPAAPQPVYPHYTYRVPNRPAPGDHNQALAAYAQAVKAQQENRLDEAQVAYGRAVQLDPAFFEAYANGGLLAYHRGDWPRALTSFETALVLKPEAVNTRYSFALALLQANYPVEAARELEKVLQTQPNETRAHLALGNLLAQKLAQPNAAREHYLKVLELDPDNPQASALRAWIATP